MKALFLEVCAVVLGVVGSLIVCAAFIVAVRAINHAFPSAVLRLDEQVIVSWIAATKLDVHGWACTPLDASDEAHCTLNTAGGLVEVTCHNDRGCRPVAHR